MTDERRARPQIECRVTRERQAAGRRPWWDRPPPGPRGRPRTLLALWLVCHAVTALAAGEPAPGGLYVDTAEGWAPAPVLTAEAAIDVAGMIGRVEIRQSFTNQADAPVEGVYLFPLPAEAAVDTLELRVGGRTVIGEIREREAARKRYLEARATGHRAGLVEQERPNLFSLAVANIPPGDTVYVHIGYYQRASFRDGRFTLELPLTVTPRYLPERRPSGTGADGLRKAANAAAPTLRRAVYRAPRPDDGLGLSVRLLSGLPLAAVEFPTHDMLADQPAPWAPGADLGFAPAAGRIPLDRDFIMQWRPALTSTPEAVAFTERFGDETYALLMLMPPQADTPLTRPREVVLVVDTSGSMAGESIRQARAALVRAVERLGPEDRFNVIEFNDEARALFPGAVAATELHRRTALTWVRGLRADGGTEMASAIELALTGGGQRLRQVVFVTDGAVGDEERLFALIRERLGESRLFTVGIGAAPNGHFMTQAARWGRGSTIRIADPENVGAEMDRLLARLERPALTDIAVDWPGYPQVEAWPSRIADLYAGEPVLLAARLRGAPGPGAGRIQLTGRGEGGHWLRQLELPAGRSAPGVAAVWARAKIAGLERALLEGGDPATVRTGILDVALDHGLVSRYTSLVAVEARPVVAPGSAVSSAPVPLVAPAGAEGIRLGSLTATATPAHATLLRAFVLLLLGLLILRFDPRRTPRWD